MLICFCGEILRIWWKSKLTYKNLERWIPLLWLPSPQKRLLRWNSNAGRWQKKNSMKWHFHRLSSTVPSPYITAIPTNQKINDDVHSLRGKLSLKFGFYKSAWSSGTSQTTLQFPRTAGGRCSTKTTLFFVWTKEISILGKNSHSLYVFVWTQTSGKCFW